MALVLCYVIGFTIIREKGYQATNTEKGTTSAKVKGSACIGDVKNYKDIKELLPLDIMDVRVPANEEGALFMLIFYTFFFIYIHTLKYCTIKHDGKDNHQKSNKKILQW